MEQLVNFVIRPPRADYDPVHDLLQPEFSLKGRRYQREDLKITNSRGHVLQCSHYMPIPTTEEKPLPCVIYCHGNSGCRADASEAAVVLLPSNITVFTLDFSGSGLSEGEFVTLGWNEMDDLKVVIAHLRTDKRVSCIGLWGRSMGAVTSLMYGAQDPSIAGMVLDSPFSNLVDLMMELVDLYKFRLPRFTLKVAIQYMRKVIQKKARFDIMDLDAIQVAKRTFIPALFGHATEDTFIQPHHSDRIYEAYLGDKNIIKFEGDHNSPRPRFYYDSINIFFHNVLQPPESPIAELAYPAAFYGLNDLDANEAMEESVWLQVLRAMQPSVSSNLDAEGFNVESLGDKSELGSGWHMSRTEVPSHLEDLQEDISRLLTNEELSAERPSSSSSQMQGSKETGDDLVQASHNETIHQNQNNLFHENLAGSRDLLSQNSFAEVPSTAEDEERMLMEAIAASLEQCSVQDDVRESEASTVPPSVAFDQGSIVATGPSETQHSQEGLQPPTSANQSIGMFEALGQKWGIGLFRAMSSKQTDKS